MPSHDFRWFLGPQGPWYELGLRSGRGPAGHAGGWQERTGGHLQGDQQGGSWIDAGLFLGDFWIFGGNNQGFMRENVGFLIFGMVTDTVYDAKYRINRI